MRPKIRPPDRLPRSSTRATDKPTQSEGCLGASPRLLGKDVVETARSASSASCAGSRSISRRQTGPHMRVRFAIRKRRGKSDSGTRRAKTMVSGAGQAETGRNEHAGRLRVWCRTIIFSQILSDAPSHGCHDVVRINSVAKSPSSHPANSNPICNCSMAVAVVTGILRHAYRRTRETSMQSQLPNRGSSQGVGSEADVIAPHLRASIRRGRRCRLACVIRDGNPSPP